MFALHLLTMPFRQFVVLWRLAPARSHYCAEFRSIVLCRTWNRVVDRLSRRYDLFARTARNKAACSRGDGTHSRSGIKFVRRGEQIHFRCFASRCRTFGGGCAPCVSRQRSTDFCNRPSELGRGIRVFQAYESMRSIMTVALFLFSTVRFQMLSCSLSFCLYSLTRVRARLGLHGPSHVEDACTPLL